jgi:hypothetical protein
MKKLELSETAFTHIFDLSPVSDIILDKENKVFQVIFCESPALEMFLRRKFENNSTFFYAQGWDNVTITSCNKKTNETTEIDTVEKTHFLVFSRTEDKNKIFWGPSAETRNTIKYSFINLQSYAFYEKE